jgi:hypothetical protein
MTFQTTDLNKAHWSIALFGGHTDCGILDASRRVHEGSPQEPSGYPATGCISKPLDGWLVLARMRPKLVGILGVWAVLCCDGGRCSVAMGGAD